MRHRGARWSRCCCRRRWAADAGAPGDTVRWTGTVAATGRVVAMTAAGVVLGFGGARPVVPAHEPAPLVAPTPPDVVAAAPGSGGATRM